MKSCSASSVSPSFDVTGLTRARGRVGSFFGFAGLLCGLSVAVLAQEAQTGGDAQGGRRRNGGTGETGGERGGRGNLNPQDMQARMQALLRERLEITDDEEWKLIADRVAKVTELRRTSGAGGGGMMFGGFGGRGGPPGGGQGASGTGGDGRGRGGSGGRGGPGAGNTELAALSTAVRDKLPDAEIKSRLERLRQARKDSEAKLTKAQEELRAVLTVRQEAVAVVFGLLP